MSNFEDDLKLGIRAQEFIVNTLQKELPGLHSIDGNFSSYDLISDSGYTVEVKFDYLSRRTPNVGIEYLYKGYPSGISKTKALDWIHIYFLNDKLVYSRIRSTELKAYIKSNQEYLTRVPAGDNKASKLILINKQDFTDKFGYIEITTPATPE